MSQSKIRPRTSHSRERELERKRREWKIEQERAREHERRKQKMIREYEERRARELGLKSHSQKSSNRSHSRSRSYSPSTSFSRNKNDSRIKKNLVMSEKLETSSSHTKVFKGADGIKIPVSDLKKIKVDIRRNIDTPDKTNELQRNIVNPEEVVLKRRDGEGAKPIFERDELRKSERLSATEIEERRTVVSIGAATSSRRRSESLSPERRHRDRSSQRDSRSDTFRNQSGRSNYKPNSSYDRRRSRDRSKDLRSSDRSKRPEYKQHRACSQERDVRHNSRRDYQDRDIRRRRYDDEIERFRGRPEMPPHYMESVPVPFYYGNYARPIMVDPMMMRAPIPFGRGRMPAMMGTVRPPYSPRFLPPVMFRPHGPPNSRF